MISRLRESFAYRAQRRQTQHHVAQLAEVDDEDVVGIETHLVNRNN